MTKPDHVQQCRWCGAVFAVAGGPGRPRQFCRRSHRQRHYEARKRAARRRIEPDEVLITRQDFDDLQDRLYVLQAALEDVSADLEGTPAVADYVDAFIHIKNAAQQLAEVRLVPRALGRD